MDPITLSADTLLADEMEAINGLNAGWRMGYDPDTCDYALL